MDWEQVQAFIDQDKIPESDFLVIIHFLEGVHTNPQSSSEEKARAHQGLRWLRAKIRERISLPLSEAFKISLRNIYIRLGRAAITAAGVFLGIAFFMYVFVSGDAINAMEGNLSEVAAQRQQLLVVLSLVVCTVGISNSMLMAVTERFKEIGTMKCLGALDGFIIKFFIIEAVLMGFFGSLAGAIFGFLMGIIIYMFKYGFKIMGMLNYGLLLEMMLVGILVGVVLSVIAAIGPAYRAASLPAAAALRIEI